MKDDFEATFVVDLAPREVWEALTQRTLDKSTDAGDEVHYVLPGFPSLESLPISGASCSPIEIREGQLLRVKKDHHPCAGTEIAVQLEQAGTGTRVTIVQSGFGPFLEIAGRDTVFAHGSQIVRDFHLFLERGVSAPVTVWRASLGARTKQTPTGLEILAIDGGFAKTAGLLRGDLLISLRGIRLHDTQQLWTVLALSDPGSSADVTWVRGREVMSTNAAF